MVVLRILSAVLTKKRDERRLRKPWRGKCDGYQEEEKELIAV